MEYEQIKYELKNSATLKLLRSDNAALILSFFYNQFKVTQRISITQEELETKLGNYLEFLQDIYPDFDRRSPKQYLSQWCDDQLLRKTFNSSDDPVFTLTPAAEKAIAWLEDLKQREEFVGTESRFLQIFSLLKEIRDRSTTDIETRITQLEQDRDRIQQEIDQIRQTGVVDPYNPTQLQERFRLANQVTTQLIADFSAVEQKFRNLTRTVQEAQLQQDTRKGSVISRVLDADQELKDSEQGRSFYAFWNFLMSTSNRQELKSLIQKIYTLEELQPLTQEYGLLRRIERILIDRGEYIVQSNHRLAEKLRQMLDERNLMENRRVAELITEVQRLALQVATLAPAEPDFWVLEGEPTVNLLMARPLHPLEESEMPTFSMDFSDLPEVMLDEEITALYQQFYVDEETLVQRIERTLEQRTEILLTELLQLYPVTQGLPEIVAYLAIATQSDRHLINTSTIEAIVITSLEPEKQFQLTLPQVIFHR
ncbi:MULTISPECIES: DUF3375 domain-containing protein [unclassified Nostoc]|uniref:DUF3375 domain-containing protein n=1 Tax=unclassified Nostoc TaxID=2593658 RepID=UPI002AD3ADA0|nr:DUF3375 domain-containing protein [Nostoc sp. DedQUE03]MDZ7976020.1 DUF3375 domain-containing protein [Nostoc sp. DedQUE03]MDZ8044850.1 DUF3375 domain-containing protein [Nostoc sp. DedQUE02]